VDLGDLLMGGFDDLLRSVFGTGGVFGFGGQRGPARGRDIAVEARIELVEAALGTTKEMTFQALSGCPTCGGTGAAEGASVEMCGRCNGTGTMQVSRRSMFGSMMTLTTCDVCHGRGKIVSERCVTCGGTCVVRQDRTTTIQIPQGVSTGTRLRLSGQGEAAPYGGSAGDLYVEIRVLSDDRFIRDGDDLLYQLDLDITQAALGSEVSIPLIEGGETLLSIPAGTQPGQRFPVSGKGIGRLGRRGRGNLTVIARVVVPTKLSRDEERALRDFAEMRGESVKSKRRFL